MREAAEYVDQRINERYRGVDEWREAAGVRDLSPSATEGAQPDVV